MSKEKLNAITSQCKVKMQVIVTLYGGLVEGTYLATSTEQAEAIVVDKVRAWQTMRKHEEYPEPVKDIEEARGWLEIEAEGNYEYEVAWTEAELPITLGLIKNIFAALDKSEGLKALMEAERNREIEVPEHLANTPATTAESYFRPEFH